MLGSQFSDFQEKDMQATKKFRVIRLGDAKRLTKGEVGGPKELSGPAFQGIG
jgi:hypothetical protein